MIYSKNIKKYNQIIPGYSCKMMKWEIFIDQSY